MRRVHRFLSVICCVACVMATVFVASFAPATAATVLEPEATTVSTSPAVNVKYIHGSIKNLWGIDIPYSPELKSDQYAVNMRYLLGMVDIANARLGAVKTSYGTGEYATAGAVSKNTADKAIKTLIQKPIEFPFAATTTAATTTFSFSITASGTFYLDWGDGGDVDKYVKTNTGSQTISHTYTTAGAYTVRIGGRATGYYEVNAPAAISFSSNKNLAGISGSLGEIFPTLADGSQPGFNRTFYNCTNLTGSIPENLFTGITGAPASYMFNSTFYNCSGLTGSIPENLFAGISGAPAAGMFSDTFGGCSGLTGAIPENLFAGITGKPAASMFSGTFANSSNLTGSIPAGMFSGISGAPAGNMFERTFNGCRGLTGSIPAGLFSGISGAPVQAMFSDTFYNCSGLTGSIPENLFAGISGAPASSMFQRTFYNCSGLTGSIPENLFAGISGAPASYMFNGTFRDCRGLTGSIPSGLFGNLSGKPASYMFGYTFCGCNGLTGEIPEKLFGNIYGAPKDFMFDGTFQNCSGLTGSIPSGLFGNISGAPAQFMFNSTFYGCKGLTGEIPLGLLGNLSGSPASSMLSQTFYNCSGLTGKSARNPDGTPLYDVFPTATSSHVYYMYTGTCLADNASIPTTWGKNSRCVYSEPTDEYPFVITTTSDTSDFEFAIFPAGTFKIDWGDGKTQTVTHDRTYKDVITHTYSTAKSYKIRIGGAATGYTGATLSGMNGLTMKFMLGQMSGENEPNTNVAKISGSVATIFPVIDGTAPRFSEMFYRCPNLAGEIPVGFFTDLPGTTLASMTFDHAFAGCSKLTGPSARNSSGEYLYKQFPSATTAQVENMYDGATGLSDYDEIPATWGGGYTEP